MRNCPVDGSRKSQPTHRTRYRPKTVGCSSRPVPHFGHRGDPLGTDERPTACSNLMTVLTSETYETVLLNRRLLVGAATFQQRASAEGPRRDGQPTALQRLPVRGVAVSGHCAALHRGRSRRWLRRDSPLADVPRIPHDGGPPHSPPGAAQRPGPAAVPAVRPRAVRPHRHRGPALGREGRIHRDDPPGRLSCAPAGARRQQILSAMVRPWLPI